MSIARRLLPALEYGPGHAYGNPLTGSGTAASVGKIGRDDLVKFHSTWFRPNGATLVIAGDTTLADIQPKLEKVFGGWRAGDLPKKNLARVEHPAKSSVYLIDRPGAQQSYIITGEVALPRNNPLEVVTDVMNDIVGGSFSSRLNMNLREGKHWSYGASSGITAARGQQLFTTVAPVQTDKTKESMVEVNKELREFADSKPVTEAELKTAIANRTLRLPGSRESLASVLGTVRQMVEFGYPDDYFDTYAGKVKGVTPGAIRDAAKTVIHPDNLVWIVVGDRAKIEQGVRELNLGEFHLIDADGNPVK
jgi:zinc protease